MLETITFYVIVGLVGLLIGLSKGGMGAVLIVLTTPLLSLVMTVPQAISLALPLLLFADGFALWVYWRQWDNSYIRLLMPAAVLGVIVGTVLLATLPELVLRRILGGFTLLFVAYRVFSYQMLAWNYQPRDWHGYVAGVASGLGSALANTGAPPFTAYMLLQRVTPLVFAGTTTLFFAAVNLLKLPGLVLAGLFDVRNLLETLWVLPFVPLGVWLGRKLIQRIDQRAFEALLLFLLLLAGLILMLTAPQPN
ncbi:MAG: sulfite exporter TauE/SafE family protein [Aggregatilineales bacterium]